MCLAMYFLTYHTFPGCLALYFLTYHTCPICLRPVLPDIITFAQAVSALYFLTDGTLLFLVRECGLGDSDIDLSVDITWWRQPGNAGRLEAALNSTSLRRVS